MLTERDGKGRNSFLFYFLLKSFNAFHITATVFIQQSLYLDDDSAACCFFFNASVQQKAVCQGWNLHARVENSHPISEQVVMFFILFFQVAWHMAGGAKSFWILTCHYHCKLMFIWLRLALVSMCGSLHDCGWCRWKCVWHKNEGSLCIIQKNLSPLVSYIPFYPLSSAFLSVPRLHLHLTFPILNITFSTAPTVCMCICFLFFF